MPCEYEIDAERGVVLSRAWGDVTDAELLSHQQRLRDDPGFQPSLNQVLDLRGITSVRDMSNEAVKTLAEGSPFGRGSRRVMITSKKSVYGIARMFQGLTLERPDEVRVVYDDDRSYEDWLGLGT